MSNDEESSIDGTEDVGPRDSRLQTFLRQASAVIAAEKGLNNVAKAKLDDLAQRLHLPDELFERGLRELQDSNSPIGNLTDYEQAFLKFLIREFSQKRKGTVLSISIEEKAIAHGRDRFGISAHRAEQLIDHQALESGIGRLSRTDAREFGRQMILDIIGDQISLDEKADSRVFRIGRRWGCDVDEVENLITSTLADNIRTAKKEQRKPLMLGAATMVCLVLIGLSAWWLVENRESVFGKLVVKKDPVPVVVDPVVAPDPAKTKSSLETAFPDFADSLTSDDSNSRGDAIATVTMDMLRAGKENNLQFDAIRAWYLQETDSAVANRFVQVIEGALDSEPVSSRNNALQLPYRAAATAKAICESSQFPDPNGRKDRLLKVLNMQFPPSTTSRDSVIAKRQWNQVIQNSWQNPGRNSILVEPLAKLTQLKLSGKEQQQFVSRSVRTIILADKSQWRNMQGAIRTAIESADDVQRMEWIDIWIDDFDGSSGFRQFTGPLLMIGSLKEPKPEARDYESFLVAERSDWRNRRLRPALLRHQRISERIEELKPYFKSVADSKVTPDLIFQTASVANLCVEAMSIMDSGRGGDESAWSDVDVQIERLDSRLRDFIFLDEQSDSDPKVASAGFDTTARDRTLAAFSDLSKSNRANRLAAIERLPKLVAKFDSIPQALADSIAMYMVSPIDADEWLQMQRVTAEFPKWPRLVLAIADRLPESTASIDQAMTMYSVLTGSPWDASDFDDWRVGMSLNLLKWAHETLLSNEAIDPNSSDSDWVRLEKFLQTAYYRRSTLLRVKTAEPSRSVLGNAKQCVRAASKDLAATDRAIGLIVDSASSEMESVVFLNQLLSEVPASPESATVGSRLLESELNLLRVWNQRRSVQLKGVTDGS